MLVLLAPKELGLSQKYGKKQGGYYLTPLRQAHQLLEARAGLLLQDDIPHMATHSDSIVATSHSSTHGMQTQIPIDKPAESILPSQETIQPSSFKDIPALPPPSPSSILQSSRPSEAIEINCNEEDSHQSDNSDSSIQASQPCQLPPLSIQAEHQVPYPFLLQQ